MSKVSDNVVFDFPSRMSDGRSMTDYRANCIINNTIPNKHKMNSYEFRYYLTTNGNNIMNDINKKYEADLKCNSCKINTTLPVQTIQNCDNSGVCSYKVNDSMGVGIERDNTY
tara:strand:+ start:35 stop:373 length:339 start_codon:yes stop_codon:yes gene_type:complete